MTDNNTRRLRLTLDEDPRGLHVTAIHPGSGEELLGEVYGAFRGEHGDGDGTPYLYVRHLDGSPWPYNPTAWEVRALVRTPQETR